MILFSYTFDPPSPPCGFSMGVVFTTDPPPSPCGFVIDVVFLSLRPPLHILGGFGVFAYVKVTLDRVWG